MTNDNRQLQNNSDAFDNLATNRTNVLDVASHYPYSPVRWRIFVDGSRVFPEYNTVSQYNHATDIHELKPNAGETVAFETTERPRYVVQFELASTFAFSINQELTGNDTIKVGLWDGTDGWYMEHNSSHLPDTADFVSKRNGSEVYRKEDIDILKPLTDFARFKLETGWYNVTRQKWVRSYSSNGEQINEAVLKASADGQRGPQIGNLPIRFEVSADETTTDLILNAGSVAQVNLGQTRSLTRDGQIFETATINTSDTWVPIRAYRVTPNREIVNIQVEAMTVRETETGEDVFMLLQSFHPSKVLDGNGDELSDSNFTTPEERESSSTVIETNDNVEQIPNDSGTVTTSTDDPGGFQIAGGAIFSGTGQDASQGTTPRGEVKRPLWGEEYGVILVNSASTGEIQYDITFEEDW